MSIPLEITVQDLELSAPVAECIREYVAELEPLLAPIVRCHVTVRPYHHHRQGDLFVLRVELDMPDEAIVVGRDCPAEHAHEDVRIAVRNTFAAVKSRVQSYLHRTRSHELAGAQAWSSPQ